MSFEKACVEQLIKKMFSGDHFSICDLDKLGEMMGVSVKSHQNYKFLSALHCVDFCDMDSTITSQLEARVAECLTDRKFNPATLSSLVTAEGRDFQFTEDRYIDTPKQDKKVIGFFSRGNK
ncbi:MAG: hypothetical protein Unbinned706contig1000_56 [Prokaryotic dsDNA virus sp.]|nr:MAG: hypothetical protein Unbinned706contig1000_56 [Prokaryotic dsDNA virus sp.]|tara:strand:- start:1849 stop:2211 length:363 start_codon:yes stop_codon:yes gene_type:complete